MAQRRAWGARELAAWLVMGIGVLTTVATSAPVDPAIAAQATVEVVPGRPVHVVIRASRSAVRHADASEISWWPAERVELALDGEPSPVESPFRFSDVEERCPGEGDCDIGMDVRLVEDVAATTVTIGARLEAAADARFLFPEDRSFPADATVTVLVE